MEARAALERLIVGHQAAQAVHVAAVLGLADLVAEEPRSVEELARETGSHEDSLCRLLRALAALGVLHELDDGRFELGELGEPLRSDHPQSAAGWAAFVGRPDVWAAWGALGHTVASGENAFTHVHGQDVWSHRAGRPDDSAAFDRAMTSRTLGVTESVLDAFDFGRFGTIVDVAGGTGAFLAAIVDRHPAARGILFDQPHVVSGAELPERCEVVAGDFFESVPAGGDAYVLKAIVHDWEDEEAVAILRTCRAGDRAGRLAAARRAPARRAERVARGQALGPEHDRSRPGGRERTLDEYAALFEAAEFPPRGRDTDRRAGAA